MRFFLLIYYAELNLKIERFYWCETREIAEYINNQAQKGTFVRVTTPYQESKWTDKSGQQRLSPEFLVNDIEILGNRKERKPQEIQSRPNLPTTNHPTSNAIYQADFEDEDIPF